MLATIEVCHVQHAIHHQMLPYAASKASLFAAPAVSIECWQIALKTMQEEADPETQEGTVVVTQADLQTGINQLDTRHDVFHAVVDIAVSTSLCCCQDLMEMLQNTISAIESQTTSHVQALPGPDLHMCKRRR